MTIPTLVRDFYERIWNAGDQSAAGELWVLGDLAGLDAMLGSNAGEGSK